MHLGKNNIDTGGLLTDYFVKNRIVKSQLGEQIHRDCVAIIRFGRSKSIQTSILIDICYALKHNFFMDIANQLPPEFTTNSASTSKQEDKDHLIELLQEELKIVRAQNEVLLKLLGK